MRYTTAGAFRSALEAHIRTRAAATGASIALLRKLVLVDRLLARLAIVAPGRWELKGGMALVLRLGTEARTTQDLDLAWRATRDMVLQDLHAVESHHADDYFTFAVERVSESDDLTGAAFRFHVRGEVAGRVFERVMLDVGLTDAQALVGDTVNGIDLLAFSGVPRSQWPVISLERHAAEKLHAYTRVYSGGRASSRTKDFVDLLLLASRLPMNAERLHHALRMTFAQRQTHAIPMAVPPPPVEWEVPFRRYARDLQMPGDLQRAHMRIGALLDPVLAGDMIGAMYWNPDALAWQPLQPG